MDAKLVSFGEIEIDGRRFTHDVVVEGGRVRKRHKGPSKVHRERYGHTPLSVDEAIPWSVARLLIGTGASGQLPVRDEVYAEAERRGIEIVAVPTSEACGLLMREGLHGQATANQLRLAGWHVATVTWTPGRTSAIEG